MTTIHNTSSLRMLPALMSEPEKQRAASSSADYTASASKTSSSSSGELDGDFFKQLLTIMALSMAMPSSSSSSGLNGLSSGASSSSSMGNFMAPVLLSLIEQLLSKQVEQVEPQATSISSGTIEGAAGVSNGETSVSDSSDAAMPNDGTPSGYPASGPMTQGSRPGHVAIDIGVSVGTDIKTTMSGKVVYAGWNNEGYGNLVIVENGGYRTYYGHLSKVPVQVGETVQAGDVIGKSGNTGNSTGPHLHYEVRINGACVNPMKYVNSSWA